MHSAVPTANDAKWVWLKIKQEGQTAGFEIHVSTYQGLAILEFRVFEPQPNSLGSRNSREPQGGVGASGAYGAPGAVTTGYHSDGPENLLAQLTGAKKVALLRPQEAKRLRYQARGGSGGSARKAREGKGGVEARSGGEVGEVWVWICVLVGGLDKIHGDNKRFGTFFCLANPLRKWEIGGPKNIGFPVGFS